VRKLILALTSMCFLYSCGGGGDADVHYKDYGIDVSKRGTPYLTPENHKDGWGKSNCLGCHQNFKHTMGTALYPPESYQNLIDRAVNEVGGTKHAIRVCSACHGANGVESFGGRACLVCHDNIKLTHFYTNTSSRKRSFHDFNNNGRIDDFDCTVCHWQPDMDGLVELDTDFAKFNGKTPKNVEDFCLKCHFSSNWDEIKNFPLADTRGYSTPDSYIDTSNQPPSISYVDWHGYNSYNASQETFKNVSLDGELLYYNPHSPLACIVCHNPHASNNDKLIIEHVGETLTLERKIIQQDNSANIKVVLSDPDDASGFEGEVTAFGKTYNLSNNTELEEYANLPVKNDNSNGTEQERITFSSLCAACHDGTKSYSPVNNLGLPIDINGHYSGRCNECHTHEKTF